MTAQPMVLLTTTPNAFSARVLAARLGAEGILWELRGNVDGPYPIGDVDVLVTADGLGDARELLLADEIEASLSAVADDDGWDQRAPRALWFVLVSIVAAAAMGLGRIITGL